MCGAECRYCLCVRVRDSLCVMYTCGEGGGGGGAKINNSKS